ncbi:hypothetical protein BU23DRAFT_482882 [Bimuria novae-zelandiae CBS 107.79]|uniref:Ricin B lectin n=1 Tax=Bimuria novae-zelandiae CBS 107.79 TaxID=1447943 RepID=A0A6A5UXI4_9PLEO|nr:hypothetical protein BU23DRAFT_482882 [Bimuria novae-zelandiae CBS 107.79]
MKFSLFVAAIAYASMASCAAITYTIQKASNPTADQQDAYTKIDAAMKLAIARYGRYCNAKCTKTIRVSYVPSVATADANYNGDMRFGSNRAYMNERTAMHEISHTLGVGQTANFNSLCASGNWRTALPLLRSFDGSSAVISCGGSHFWPYGLNYDTEWSETNANRHVQMMQAMLNDGM